MVYYVVLTMILIASLNMGMDIECLRVFMRDRLLRTRIWDKDKAEDLCKSFSGRKNLSIGKPGRTSMEINHEVAEETRVENMYPCLNWESDKLKTDQPTTNCSMYRLEGSSTVYLTQFNARKLCGPNKMLSQLKKPVELYWS